MTYYDTIAQTIPGRDIKRTVSTQAEITRLERWLSDCAHLSFTAGYRANVERLAALKAHE